MCQWISVSDKLPPHRKDVLVAQKYGKPFVGYWDSERWWWINSSDDEARSIYSHLVTHWAKIAPLPEED